MTLHVQHNKPASSSKPARRTSARLAQHGLESASSAPPQTRPSTFRALPGQACGSPEAVEPSVAAGDAIQLPADAFAPPYERHPARLIYSPNGVLVVQNESGHWVVPPVTALRLMPGTPYTLRKADQVQVRTIDLPDALSRRLWADNCLYRLTSLSRELLESINARATSHRDGNDSRMLFLVDQLAEAGLWQDERRHRCRSAPKDPRVAYICDYLYHNLDTNKTLQEWAVELKNDTRTLHRLFVQEFGMPFVQWRQQIRLMAALEWLAEGRQVMDVALDLGYQTQSAFAAMFRRNMGITPSNWQDKRHPHGPCSRYMTAPAK